jgi:multiple sugar transport system ATP-binding protein
VSQVVLENIYKSFPPRKGESIAEPTQSTLSSGKQIDAQRERADNTNVLRRINLTIADGEFMVLVGPSVVKVPYYG